MYLESGGTLSLGFVFCCGGICSSLLVEGCGCGGSCFVLLLWFSFLRIFDVLKVVYFSSYGVSDGGGH